MRISDWSSDVCSSDLDLVEVYRLLVHAKEVDTFDVAPVLAEHVERMREESTGQLHYVVMLTRVICELRYEIPVSYSLALIWVAIDPLYFRPAFDIGLQCVPIASRSE